MRRRYAAGTAVDPEKSRGEMTGLLTTHGCRRMAWASDADEGDTLEFELGGQRYRWSLRRPTREDIAAMAKEDGKDIRLMDVDRAIAAEWRRRWRAHVLLLKAKLEFVETGETSLEREFMPNLVLPNGQVLAEAVGGMLRLEAGS